MHIETPYSKHFLPSVRWLEQLKPLARNKDKEHTERGIDDQRHRQDSDCPLSEKLTDIRFFNAREIERGVLAETDKGEDRV